MKRRILFGLVVAVCAVGIMVFTIPRHETNPPISEAPIPLSPLAGNWYPDNREELVEQITGFIQNSTGERYSDVNALILPHAGYEYSGQTAAFGVSQLQGREFSRVIVMGPSHRVPMSNMAAIPSGVATRTPLGTIPYDVAFIETLRHYSMIGDVPPGGELEHSVEIEVPLLQQVIRDFQLVPLILGRMDEKALKKLAAILLGLLDERTLVVASSDFTHYGPNYDYMPFRENVRENLRSLDMGAFSEIEKKDPAMFRSYCERTGATICGEVPIAVLLSMLPAETSVHLLNYDTSGRLTNDDTNSVSYMAVGFGLKWIPGKVVTEDKSTQGLTPDQEKELIGLAHKTLEYAFKQRRIPSVSDLGYRPEPETERIAGVFVTLEEKGELRGCIGDIFPEGPIYEAVIANALSAAFADPRFPPLTVEELPEVSIEITILSAPKSVSGYQEIVLGKHGILISKNGKRAVFLPQVAPEQGWDLPQTLTHLSMKAGLSGDDWKVGASFEVFEGIVFGEAGG